MMNPYHNTYDRLRAEREAEAGYTALPPTLQTRMGQGLQGYLGGLRSMQPTDNPYGKAAFDFFLSGAEDMAGEMARGNPYAVIDPRPRGPYINPQILDTLGILPVATAAKIPSEVIAPGLLAGGAAAMGKIAKPTDGTPSLLEAMTPGMVDPRTGLLSMTGYHGTAAKFPPTEKNPLGEFDLKMIGTGEGAQAYGHGIYVAERPGIAKRYEQNQVEKMQWDELYEERGELYDELEKVDFLGYDSAEEAFDDILRTRRKQGKDWVNSFDILEDHEWDKVSSGLEFEEVLKKQKKLYKLIEKQDPYGGSFYEVDIPDEIVDNEMLDWDAPFDKQSESVQRAVQQITQNNPEHIGLASVRYASDTVTGEELYKYITNIRQDKSLASQQEASALLNQHGIKGIKYKDATSRGKEGGTRNFVLFDPSIATITGRN